MSDSKNAKPYNPSHIAWITGAVCIACCAVPLAGIAIGSATLAGFALYSEGVAIAIAIAMLGAAFLAYKFISRRKAPSCRLDCDGRPMRIKKEQ